MSGSTKSIPGRKRRPRSQKDYEVGFGRPPVKSRFKPGQSGNPHGRPKGSRNATTIVHELLNHRVDIQAPTGARKGTLLEAIIWKQIELATKGDGKAVRTLLDIEDRVPRDNGGDKEQGVSSEDEALLQELLDRNARPKGIVRKK